MKTAVLPFTVGDRSSFSKTITETDVYLFAGISGDMNKVHLNEEYAKQTTIGTRIAHGMLTFSIGSTTQTLLLGQKDKELEEAGLTYLSYGYDKVRFLKPVFYGDTVEIVYEIVRVDQDGMKTFAKETATNQRGELVFVCDHILKFLSKK